MHLTVIGKELLKLNTLLPRKNKTLDEHFKK